MLYNTHEGSSGGLGQLPVASNSYRLPNSGHVTCHLVVAVGYVLWTKEHRLTKKHATPHTDIEHTGRVDGTPHADIEHTGRVAKQIYNSYTHEP